MKKLAAAFIVIGHLCWFMTPAMAQEQKSTSTASSILSESLANAVLGEHHLTLQWLDNENQGNHGTLTIIEQDGVLLAKGLQEDNVGGELNYMRISGEVTVVSLRELHLNGLIETRVDHINQGEPLIRTGLFIFKAHGKRQYWRLQNQREHEVTDYIDIHFKR